MIDELIGLESAEPVFACELFATASRLFRCRRFAVAGEYSESDVPDIDVSDIEALMSDAGAERYDKVSDRQLPPGERNLLVTAKVKNGGDIRVRDGGGGAGLPHSCYNW